MGNFASKKASADLETSRASNSVGGTPGMVRKLSEEEGDPRSPTLDVPRTPMPFGDDKPTDFPEKMQTKGTEERIPNTETYRESKARIESVSESDVSVTAPVGCTLDETLGSPLAPCTTLRVESTGMATIVKPSPPKLSPLKLVDTEQGYPELSPSEHAKTGNAHYSFNDSQLGTAMSPCDVYSPLLSPPAVEMVVSECEDNDVSDVEVMPHSEREVPIADNDVKILHVDISSDEEEDKENVGHGGKMVSEAESDSGEQTALIQ